MHKFFFGLGLAAGALGLYESSYAPLGSNAQFEAGLLIMAAPVLLIIGFVVSRVTQKNCPSCSERVKKAAIVCRHCKSSIS